MHNQIQWINALSTRPSLEAAIAEIADCLQKSLLNLPDLGILFISSAYASEYLRVLPLLLEKFPLPVLIGCGGGGIIGINSQNQVMEIEDRPAISLSVAHLPNVEVHPFHILAENLPDLDSSPEKWVELIGVPPEKQPHFILLADTFSSKINDLLEGLDFAYPGSIKIGGLASSGSMGTQSGLFYHSHTDSSLYQQGTIGIALSGNIILETIVAQGCRPIGPTYIVNQGERNVIIELTDTEGKSLPPLELLRELIQSLSEEDRQLAQHSLFVGIARDEFKLQLDTGDFLIRNLLGVDPRYGAIAIGDRVRPGQRIQFHLRDAQASATDLEMLLRNYQNEKTNAPPTAGALIFSCLGRGENLYGKPNFDSELFRRYLNNIQIGGFFCSGEIGPVGGRTFLHGYTSAFGIIRQPL
ncbi:MAG: FIST C-terminal domain-containing protein [Gomphosphaeria aponina SAG 52.96 = DSM 107014]|uniref:FIST C-terminal domain-containing protein n=1 Tax=Gomphosphaeria aponina SAG 52.96 = DSM 107014 TaxID=1521640 RepID=A0A941GX20_9CHRO|nr:FIST C-terminal domain-containing protein [Gomphosphaeria aponina SAG 52.96 = DSM 107014]